MNKVRDQKRILFMGLALQHLPAHDTIDNITNRNGEKFMRISPYISFSGNCAEAVAFYEKAFNVKAQVIRYKDAPQDSGYSISEGTENLVMHAHLELNGEMIMLCDMPPEYPIKAGENIAVMLEFDNVETAKTAFEALKEGGNVSMELGETFWSKCFGSLTDKFGINWNLSLVE